MRFAPGIPALLPGLLLLGCGGLRAPSSRTPAIDSAGVAQARAAASDLGSDLMGMLSSEMARGGPAAAVAVCADSAQERTARHQQAGVQVRRIGTRVRNPANTPDSLEALVLAAFAAGLTTGRLPMDTAFVQPLASGGYELRYLRPIQVQEKCLACHGPADRLAPGVLDLIAARYPADRAMGYAVGDLRGAITVRLAMPLAPAR
ncbi:MAG: hypothetical protein H6Q77_1000 [Gemmatimonadetes bacterium]|nr:hypothetical protein [Gemmatimonadota bacterium]